METDEPGVIDESDLEDLSSDALIEDDLDGEDVLDVEDDLDIEDLGEDVDGGTEDSENDLLVVDLNVPVVADGAPKAAKAKTKGDRHDDEEDDDEDEEVIDEDVEASLDVILKERLVVDDDEDEDEVVEADDRSDSVAKVLPKQPDEFVCQSCFLVKHPSQLADPGQMLCRDCV